MLDIKVKKLTETAIIPIYGSQEAAACDLYADLGNVSEVAIEPQTAVKIHTGLAFELPAGWCGYIMPRSGLATKKGLRLSNSIGLCDCDYRGEYIVSVYNDSNVVQTISNHERFAQLMFVPYMQAIFTEVEELGQTERGEGGFGSTGNH